METALMENSSKSVWGIFKRELLLKHFKIQCFVLFW